MTLVVDFSRDADDRPFRCIPSELRSVENSLKVGAVYPLMQAAEAYSAKAAGGIPGKVVLQP